jgi:PST family polysaccharide transporter
VQRVTVTPAQASTLFWINILAGTMFFGVALVLAPAVAAFYREPRLSGITSVIASGFLFNAAGVQHAALLQRQMRFTTLSVIDFGSYVVATAIAIGLAKAGYGYWALVGMTVTIPLATTIAFWFTTGWVPGMPRRRSGIRSMLHYGGTLTLHGLVAYIAINSEKLLLGRFWGAEAIGIYGRAYQLSRIPTDTLNTAVGEVAFSALSRLQNDPKRFRSYFLKGYSLVLALTVPATFACGLFSNDMVAALLGSKWKDAAPIFRLLAPTIAVFAITNPLNWLIDSIGLVGRGLKMSLIFGPLMVTAYCIGLTYGPRGVAVAYSIVMVLSVIPIIAWSVYGTAISFTDVGVAVSRPLVSSGAASVLCVAIRSLFPQVLWLKLACETVVFLGCYVWLLLHVMGQKPFYVDLLWSLKSSLEPSLAKHDEVVLELAECANSASETD